MEITSYHRDNYDIMVVTIETYMIIICPNNEFLERMQIVSNHLPIVEMQDASEHTTETIANSQE